MIITCLNFLDSDAMANDIKEQTDYMEGIYQDLDNTGIDCQSTSRTKHSEQTIVGQTSDELYDTPRFFVIKAIKSEMPTIDLNSASSSSSRNRINVVIDGEASSICGLVTAFKETVRKNVRLSHLS